MGRQPDYRLAFSASPNLAAPLSTDILERAARAALRMHEISACKLSFVQVSDEEIAELNAHHLDHEGPTDVLTFDLAETPSSGSVEGEIVMSADTAAGQASARGHSPEVELALYAVHGLLHLLGYDDHEPDQAARMHEMENQVFSAIGLGRVFGPIGESDAGRGDD